MKITSIDVYDFGKCLNYEDCSPICIRINTDAGISGFGEVGLAYGNAHNAGVWPAHHRQGSPAQRSYSGAAVPHDLLGHGRRHRYQRRHERY